LFFERKVIMPIGYVYNVSEVVPAEARDELEAKIAKLMVQYVGPYFEKKLGKPMLPSSVTMFSSQ